MNGLNTYDYGARQYDGAKIVWDRMDQLCEEKPWNNPYVFCSANPVNRIDPDGREIWILYYDEDNNEQHIQYTVGMTCNIDNENVRNIINNLNAMVQNESGKIIINTLAESSSIYNYGQGSASTFDAEGYYDPKTNTTCLQDPKNTLTFAEETFHMYQNEKGRGGATIVNEVEAKLFSSKMNAEIEGWNMLGAYNTIGTACKDPEMVNSLSYLMYTGYDSEKFSYVVNHFLTDSFGGPIYAKKNYSIGTIDPEPLIKRFFPIIRQ